MQEEMNEQLEKMKGEGIEYTRAVRASGQQQVCLKAPGMNSQEAANESLRVAIS